MADINFNCEACGQNLDAPEEMAGERIDCPACGRSIVIPKPTREAYRISDLQQADGSRISPQQLKKEADLKPDAKARDAEKSSTVRIEIPDGYTVPQPPRRVVTIKRAGH